MPQVIPGGDIYPALEKGTIDAAEWVGPYAKFKKIHDQWKQFLDDEHQWFRVEERQFDNYMLSPKKS